jgi:NAD(P)-dependent dehydrogenase (short-subunit alcohol dehydrogenase family)
VSTALVTGGAAGIGRATAGRFVHDGRRVAIVDRDAAAGDRAARELGPSVRAFAADVSRGDDVEAAFAAALDWLGGRLDALVNNAGIAHAAAVDDHSEADWDRVFAVNAKSAFLATRAALPALRRARGAIVNVSSMTALVGQPRGAAYTASKGALVAFTKALALELAPDGVRVNCVCPAGVDTPLMRDWAAQQADPAGVLREQAQMHLVGRMATPDEIADVIAFLAGDGASFVTGVVLPVEGGATLGYRRVS